MKRGIFLPLLLEFDRKDGKSNLGFHEFPETSSWEHCCVLSSLWKGRVRPPEDTPGELCLTAPAGFILLGSLQTIPITPMDRGTNRPTAHTGLHKAKDF